MKYRIAYCKECGKEYQNVMSKYGEKCDCGAELYLAYKVEEKSFSCVKIDHNISIAV